MKFILLYRGNFGVKQLQVFETREEAISWSKTSVMADKEIFGIFELENPAVIPSFFQKHQLADLSKTATIYSKPIIIEIPWTIKKYQNSLLN